jgi:hypothetical protein
VKTIAVLGFVLGSLVAVAQVAAQENIRLHFELFKNGKPFGAPTVTVKSGETGSLELGNIGSAKLSFTPSRIDAQKIAVAFEVVTGEKTLKPRVVLLSLEPGQVSLKSSSDSFDVRVFVLPREVAAAR